MKKKNQLLIAFLFAIFTILVAHASKADPEQEFIVHSNNAEICSAIDKILHLKENENYLLGNLSDQDVRAADLFKIPNSNKNFRMLMWRDSTSENLWNSISDKGYRSYMKERDTGKIKNVRVASFDLFNSGMKNTVYKIYYNNGAINFFLGSGEYSKFFNDNSSGISPFFFKDRTYFASRAKDGRLFIGAYDLKKSEHEEKTSSGVCVFSRPKNR